MEVVCFMIQREIPLLILNLPADHNDNVRTEKNTCHSQYGRIKLVLCELVDQ